MSDESRRSFLGKLSLTAPAVGVFGATATVSGEQPPTLPRAIPGRPSAPFSRAVTFGQLAFISGVVGTKPDTGELASARFEPQCRQALENLKASVESAGSCMSNVLKCTGFLVESADFGRYNELYRSFFPSDPPARSTVVVKELVVPGAKLEIDCVACLT